MATVLYRVGSFAHRRRWLVLAAWAVVIAVAVGLAAGLKGETSNEFIPAVHRLLGDRGWWLPRALDRALPNLDIEGEQLHAP